MIKRLILITGMAFMMVLDAQASIDAVLILKTPKMEAYKYIQAPGAPVNSVSGGDAPVLLMQSQLLPYSAHFYSGSTLTAKEIQPGILGPVLNYPNPFRLSEGTQIGYSLTKNLDMELQIYDMLGHRVYKREIMAGDSNGGLSGYNLVPFGQLDVGSFALPAAVYFYYLIHDGKVLGKGKMVIRP